MGIPIVPLKAKRNDHHFTDYISKSIFLNENYHVVIALDFTEVNS